MRFLPDQYTSDSEAVNNQNLVITHIVRAIVGLSPAPAVHIFTPYQYDFPGSADVCRLNLIHAEATGTIL
jgi:hypothetical protein